MPKSGPKCFVKNIAFFFTILFCLTGHSMASSTGWWNEQWHYRLLLTVDPDKVKEVDSPVATPINFSVVLKSAQIRGVFVTNTLRLVEVDPTGKVVDDTIPLQFDLASTYHPTRFAQGTLTFLLKGATNSTRYFHLYFDTNEAGSLGNLIQGVNWPGAQISAAKVDSAPERTPIYIGSVQKRPASVNTIPRNIAMRSSSGSFVTKSPIASVEPEWKFKTEHQFFAGYCTWYAARKWKEFTGAPVTWHGDGGSWFDNASEEGRIVSDDPKAAVPGAVMVWTRRGRAGHVAFVEEVTEEGVRISEMNVKGRWVVSEAFLPFSNLDKGTKYKFKGYVLPENAGVIK